MLKQNRNRLTFASLGNRGQPTALAGCCSQGNFQFEKISMATDRQPFSQCEYSGVIKEPNKVVKLIGDKEKNICELVDGFHCICGWKTEFKNIVNLLMDKIYKLREQRNQLKEELAFLQYTPRKQSNDKQFQDASTNTESVEDSDRLPEKLRSFTFQSEHTLNKKDFLTSVKTEQIEQLFGLGPEKSHNWDQWNQTNLLKSSFRSEENLSLSNGDSSQEFEKNVLQEHNSNCDNKLKDFSDYMHKNRINLNNLEKYIEKINCARQLGKYDENKRNKVLF